MDVLNQILGMAWWAVVAIALVLFALAVAAAAMDYREELRRRGP